MNFITVEKRFSLILFCDLIYHRKHALIRIPFILGTSAFFTFSHAISIKYLWISVKTLLKDLGCNKLTDLVWQQEDSTFLAGMQCNKVVAIPGPMTFFIIGIDYNYIYIQIYPSLSLEINEIKVIMGGASETNWICIATTYIQQIQISENVATPRTKHTCHTFL